MSLKGGHRGDPGLGMSSGCVVLERKEFELFVNWAARAESRSNLRSAILRIDVLRFDDLADSLGMHQARRMLSSFICDLSLGLREADLVFGDARGAWVFLFDVNSDRIVPRLEALIEKSGQRHGLDHVELSVGAFDLSATGVTSGLSIGSLTARLPRLPGWDCTFFSPDMGGASLVGSRTAC